MTAVLPPQWPTTVYTKLPLPLDWVLQHNWPWSREHTPLSHTSNYQIHSIFIVKIDHIKTPFKKITVFENNIYLDSLVSDLWDSETLHYSFFKSKKVKCLRLCTIWLLILTSLSHHLNPALPEYVWWTTYYYDACDFM